MKEIIATIVGNLAIHINNNNDDTKSELTLLFSTCLLT